MPDRGGLPRGTVAPLPISAAAQPPGIGYPAGFVGASVICGSGRSPATRPRSSKRWTHRCRRRPDPVRLDRLLRFLREQPRERGSRLALRPGHDRRGRHRHRAFGGRRRPRALDDPGRPVRRCDAAPRLPEFAPYLAVPYSNFASKNVDLTLHRTSSSTRSRSRWAIRSSSRSPAVTQTIDGPFQVDFFGFTTNPADHDSHPVLVSYPQLRPISGVESITNYVNNNMAAAFIAPASGTYLIRSQPARAGQQRRLSRRDCSSASSPATATA